MSHEEDHGKNCFFIDRILNKISPKYIIVIIVILLDQLTKIWIINRFKFGSYVLIPNILSITIVRNTGAAFGIFREHNLLLIIITILVILFSGFYLLSANGILSIALSLIIGGALGNLIDRIIFGHVIDFIDINVWPVFNLADSSVTIGAILLLISIFKHEKYG